MQLLMSPFFIKAAAVKKSIMIRSRCADQVCAAGTLRQAGKVAEPIRLLVVVGAHLLVVHKSGADVWQLSRDRQDAPAPHSRACQGLNGSSILAAAYQESRGGPGRLFALTDDGHLLTFGSQILTACTVSCRASLVPPLQIRPQG